MLIVGLIPSRPTRAGPPVVWKYRDHGILGRTMVERRICQLDVLLFNKRILPRMEYLAGVHYRGYATSTRVESPVNF
jgi:hypothetical protein